MAQKITWGLRAEHPDSKIPIPRAPKKGDEFYRENDGAMKISSVIDHEGEVWIILENGEEESSDEILPIAKEKEDGTRR